MSRLADARLYRMGTAMALALGPALFLADNLIHPEELPNGNEARQLAEIGANYGRWQLAHLIGFLSLLALAAGLLGLAYLVRRRRPLLGLVGGAMALAGLMAAAFAFALDGFTWAILGEVWTRQGVDRQSIELALHDVQTSTWALPYLVLILLWFAGMAALAWGAARARAVPLWAAAVFVLGGVLTALDSEIQDNAWFLLSSGVLLVGGVATGAALWRLGDEGFAAGGPPV